VTERMRRPQQFVYQPFVSRQHEKIWRILAVIEAELPEALEPPDLGQVTLGCALGYLEFRLPDLDWRRRFPRLASRQSAFQRRPSMAATQPRAATAG
jgi:glutathione S-transferase